ncbi:MAG: type II toxin-antitoxin system prevent-host-death family antitoxin [Saccharofermentanales bacterium]
MKISTKSIVSNSDMIKNYKTCREMAEVHGRIYILKNNQPDAVLLSISEYERLSAIIEHTEGLDEARIAKIADSIRSVDI